MGRSNGPIPAELLPILMLVLQLSTVSALLWAKRQWVGDRCAALCCAVGWGGAACCDLMWHGEAWGAAAWGRELLPSHPASAYPAEILEEVTVSDKHSESPAAGRER